MKMRKKLVRATLAMLAASASIVQASSPLPFAPLNFSVFGDGPNLMGSKPENAPFYLPTGFTQAVVVDQQGTFTPGVYTPGTVGGGVRWGNWDMLTLNETGPDAGRYMFIPHEIAGQGVSRYDFQTNTMVNLVPNNTVPNGRLDPSRWTPWGSVIAADEDTAGSIFEITNPLAAPGVATSVRRLDVGRVAFEGISRASDGNWYYGDESGTGAIFKYVPLAANVGTANELVGGQIFALKLTAPGTDATSGNATGSGAWVALNDASGNALFGANGGSNDPRVNSRNAALAAGATTWNRPEDSILTTLANGHLAYMITITGTHSTITVDIDPNGVNASVKDFANRATMNLANNLVAGARFDNPDNIALGPDGRVYIVEDGEPNGGDIWATVDLNNDGDLFDAGEGFGRWASLSTLGSEPTGMYYDAFRNQWLINVQHPTSGNGMTIAISGFAVPEPTSLGLLGLAGLSLIRRRRLAN